MKCVVCKKLMKLVRKNTSVNPKNKKKYDRTIYRCTKDDVWIGVEKPKKKIKKKLSK